MYLLKLGLRSWRSEPGSQILTSLSGAALALGAYALFLVAADLGPRVKKILGHRILTVYLQPGGDAVIDSVRATLGAAPGRTFDVKSAQDVLKELQAEDEDLARQLAGLGRDAAQVVPRYVRISGDLPARSEEAVKKITGVESVEVTTSPLRPLASSLTQLKRLSFGFGIVLLVAWWTALFHLFRVSAMRRDADLSLLTLWGASRAKLLTPALTHAVLVGCTSAIFGSIAFVVARGVLVRVFQSMEGWEGTQIPPMSHAFLIALGILAVTLVAGLFQGARWSRRLAS